MSISRFWGVTNTKPGERPAVALKITDKKGFPIETSQMNSLSLLISGPNTDFASYWRESALSTPSQNGMLTYTFQQAIPADAKGSYSVAVEGYRSITLQPGTTKEVEVRDAGFNKILPFAVTDSYRGSSPLGDNHRELQQLPRNFGEAWQPALES